MAFDSGNNPLTNPHERYDFSFLSATLRWREIAQVAAHDEDKSIPDTVIIESLGAGSTETGKRILREMRKRLTALNEAQINLLINGNASAQKQIAFLAICKKHHFIRDFVLEVLREKHQSYETHLTEGDYISFLRNKTIDHPEIEEISDSSLEKVRSRTLTILEQAGLTEGKEERSIQPQFLEFEVIRVIVEDAPQWLTLFLFSDEEIREMIA